MFSISIGLSTWLLGLLWFLAFPHSLYNRGTYVSENALMPGTADTEFSQSDAKQFEQFYTSLSAMTSVHQATQWVASQLEQDCGNTLVRTQNFTYKSTMSINATQGTTVYAMLKAPRSDGAETLILTAPLRHADSSALGNQYGVALLMSIAKTFCTRSYWAKDIVFVLPDHGLIGIEAWLQAYAGRDKSYNSQLKYDKLQFHPGVIQAGLNLDFGNEKVFSGVGLQTEGTNGQMPNLDLINILTRIAGPDGVPLTLHDRVFEAPGVEYPYSEYLVSLKNTLYMMQKHVSSKPTNVHGVFHKYKMDVVTVKGLLNTSNVRVSPWQMGVMVEGTIRSLNNLLEPLHQSFFFYLLPSHDRFISIGMYYPPLILVAIGLLLQALAIWYTTSDNYVRKQEKKAKKAVTVKKGSLRTDTLKAKLSEILQPSSAAKSETAEPVADKVAKEVKDMISSTPNEKKEPDVKLIKKVKFVVKPKTEIVLSPFEKHGWREGVSAFVKRPRYLCQPVVAISICYIAAAMIYTLPQFVNHVASRKIILLSAIQILSVAGLGVPDHSIGQWVFLLSIIIGVAAVSLAVVTFRVTTRSFTDKNLHVDTFHSAPPIQTLHCFCLIALSATLLAISILNFSLAFVAAVMFVPLYLSLLVFPAHFNHDPYDSRNNRGVSFMRRVFGSVAMSVKVFRSVATRSVLLGLCTLMAPPVSMTILQKSSVKMDIDTAVNMAWQWASDVIINWVGVLESAKKLASHNQFESLTVEYYFTSIVSLMTMFFKTVLAVVFTILKIGSAVSPDKFDMPRIEEWPSNVSKLYFDFNSSGNFWNLAESGTIMVEWSDDFWLMGRWTWPIVCFLWWPAVMMAGVVVLSRRT